MPKRSLLIAAAILIAISLFTAWFFRSKPSVEQQQELLHEYVMRQQADAALLFKDTGLLRKLVLHAESKEEFERIKEKKYGVFLFAETLSDNQDLLFWNKQTMLPPENEFFDSDSVYFRQFENGYFVVQRHKIDLPGMSNNIVGYTLIPVLYKYFLETTNSQTEFAHDENALKKIRIASVNTEFPILSASGSTLFYIEGINYNSSDYAEPFTLALRLFAFILLMIYLHLLIEVIHRKRGALIAVIVLCALLTCMRLFLLQFPELLSLRQLKLFDPLVYASDNFNRSLGDLLISSLFVCWAILYAWNTLGPVKKIPSFLKSKGIIAAGVAGVCILIFSTFQLASLVNELVTNSKISFDVTNFFGLDIYTVFGFVVLAVISLSYYYFSRLLFRFILLAFPNMLHLYFAVAAVGLIYLSLQSAHEFVLFYLPVLAWLVIYTLLLSQEQLIINRLRITFAGILFWIFVFSISLAVLVLQGTAAQDVEQRKSLAEKYNQLTDPSKEQTLRVALSFLTDEFLRDNFSRFADKNQNLSLRDSFIQVNSLGYANSYSTEFYVFDRDNQPLNNDDNTSYEELINVLQVQSKPTPFPDLFYYETSYDQFVYITRKEIRNGNTLLGTLFVVAAPKHFQTANNLSPNLFKSQIDNNRDNPYAIYKNNKLSIYSSKYPFSTTLSAGEVPVKEFEERVNGDFDELWFRPNNQKVVVIAEQRESLIASITLFSYLFCAFLLMVGLIRLLAVLVRYIKDRRSVSFFGNTNIRTQIHGTIIFISVLSFLVIGAAIISFIYVRYNRANTDRLSTTASGTIKELKQKVKEKGLLKNGAIDFSDSSSLYLDTLVTTIAEAHGEIVNVYDMDGNLRVSSDQVIYKKGILNRKMEPTAFFNLNNLRSVQFVQNEQASKLNYLSIYTVIQNDAGDAYAFLNIPSFTSQIELNQEISNFIVTIINLNAFILLIAGVIALFITNRITRTFSVIGNKMKEITLGKANEEIVWTRSDEIGELVKQYNKMVHQLEQSANALAKSEREGAWREMARQVAHEIKNPLTPMKLSIQYLQNAINKGQDNVQQLTSNVANTLIEQIDHLSKIAADFSQFANIGIKKVEQLDLHTVLESLVNLYAADDRMTLQWNKVPQPIVMRTDKTQMNRLFTNLLTNAVDACSKRSDCKIVINEQRSGDFILVSISDNGEGIPADMQSKIFTPNFTTKTSGTGLGLAMCKSIVEQFGGSIWFETKQNAGTVFHVRLPLDVTLN